jgi:hypothetical protein
LLELLRLIDGDKNLQIDLIKKLQMHFQGVTTKSAIEFKLKEVAVREGRKVDSAWRVLPEAWVSDCLLWNGDNADISDCSWDCDVCCTTERD